MAQPLESVESLSSAYKQAVNRPDLNDTEAFAAIYVNSPSARQKQLRGVLKRGFLDIYPGDVKAPDVLSVPRGQLRQLGRQGYSVAYVGEGVARRVEEALTLETTQPPGKRILQQKYPEFLQYKDYMERLGASQVETAEWITSLLGIYGLARGALAAGTQLPWVGNAIRAALAIADRPLLARKVAAGAEKIGATVLPKPTPPKPPAAGYSEALDIPARELTTGAAPRMKFGQGTPRPAFGGLEGRPPGGGERAGGFASRVKQPPRPPRKAPEWAKQAVAGYRERATPATPSAASSVEARIASQFPRARPEAMERIHKHFEAARELYLGQEPNPDPTVLEEILKVSGRAPKNWSPRTILGIARRQAAGE